jgi:hypothetical protein
MDKNTKDRLSWKEFNDRIDKIYKDIQVLFEDTIKKPSK